MVIRVTYIKEYDDLYCTYCGEDIHSRLVTINNKHIHLECWYPYISSKLTTGETSHQQAHRFGVAVRTIYRWRTYKDNHA